MSFDITWLAVLLVSIAAHRLWALWLFTEITRPLRERLQKLDGWWGRKLAYLSGCGFCVSVWAGGMATGLWTLGPLGQVAVFGLVAGSGALFYEMLMTRINR
jgi:hypothetical protein